MKRIILVILLISIMCFMGCENISNKNKEKETETDLVQVSQEIVFICHYSNWSDMIQERGFYIDKNGKKVEYDISEIVDEKKQQLRGFLDIYKILLELDESELYVEEYLSVEEVSKCHNLLIGIGDDYELNEKTTGMDCGEEIWYGVIDDGVNEPEFIVLSGEGDYKIVNSNKNAHKILDILIKE